MNNLDIKPNNLKKIRIGLGLTLTDLSRLSNVSSKSISRTERHLINPTQVTKNKIIIGLNTRASSGGTQWKYEDIFPNET